MRCIPSGIPEVLIIEPDVHRDSRGFFVETYQAEKYRASGIPSVFVQDNHTRSLARTVRGLHMQRRRPQAKLVRVIAGEIYDVAVDLRRGSPSFGRSVSVVLSAENFKQCYIPTGFAHGFCVLTSTAEVEYKCSDFYDPADDFGIAWNDPTLAIEWPVTDPILSDRDKRNPTLAEIADTLPAYVTEL
ncbi:MAG TPA: dTDP-4-dehydrorhamnose 3,5-epimerase [Vicinamibacterales bacterium]